MSFEEYFKDWCKVIDKNELKKSINRIQQLKEEITPSLADAFKAFELCDYDNTRVIVLGLDPYPQKNVATGVAFANHKDTIKLSPSLEVLKNSMIDKKNKQYDVTFDITLEDIAKQGVLFLNTSLTTKLNSTGSHLYIWKDFIATLLTNFGYYNPNTIYVLLGDQAKSFKRYIKATNYIFEDNHPSYYARIHKDMPSKIWSDINQILINLNNYCIKWYKEYDTI